jgi:glycosyltransferase involved in cell wall biosynthesis
LEIDYETLDALTEQANAEGEIEAPTGVGFCMYMRRDCLKEVGSFDEVTFGKGYGEENDYCQRALKHGWRNIIATDIFVLHYGGASFMGEKAKRCAVAMEIMNKRHPEYKKAVNNFIHQDPLLQSRQKLDWERLIHQARKENILIVCHNRGGGAERHVQEDTRRLQEQGKGVYFLRPENGRPTHTRLEHPACQQLPNLHSLDLGNTIGLASALKKLRISCIHSHGLVDFQPKAPDLLLALARTIDVPLHVDIHDYKIICPRINLIDNNGRYCGEPDEQKCDICLVKHGNDFGVRSIREWRELHHRVLQLCENIWVPDQDVAARLSRYYPDIIFSVLPHENLDLDKIPIQKPQLHASERLRIVVIGAISKMKGYDVLIACAGHAQKQQLPIDYIVMGYGVNDRLLEKAGVFVTGRYLEQEADEKLCSLSPHTIWLPSIWPETYSYTLSLALKSGFPIFSFDIGAIARRLREIGRHNNLLPIALADTPDQINALFMKYRENHIIPPYSHASTSLHSTHMSEQT